MNTGKVLNCLGIELQNMIRLAHKPALYVGNKLHTEAAETRKHLKSVCYVYSVSTLICHVKFQ